MPVMTLEGTVKEDLSELEEGFGIMRPKSITSFESGLLFRLSYEDSADEEAVREELLAIIDDPDLNDVQMEWVIYVEEDTSEKDV